MLERDDGYVLHALDADFFFAERHAWDPYEQKAMDAVRGKVLDVGCGAGRHALDLQSKGHAVVAIDVSPVAIELCRSRGVTDARVMPLSRIGPGLGVFDGVLMMCGNWGLFESAGRAARLLRRLDRMTTPEARIVADSVDPLRTTDPAHLAYHEANVARGRYPGQVRIRIRYRRWATPWFEYLNSSPNEMAQILEGTPWQIEDVFDDGGADYAAVLRKRFR